MSISRRHEQISSNACPSKDWRSGNAMTVSLDALLTIILVARLVSDVLTRKKDDGAFRIHLLTASITYM